jgi:hypothetical protein
MAVWTLKLESIGLSAFLPWRRPVAAAAAAGADTAQRRRLGERRAEAMRGLFPKLSAWMAERHYLAQMSEVDRYLSQATGMPDLERRIREIESRGGRWI